MNTHGFLMPTGRHKDQPITRVPVSYLRWMVGSRHTLADVAQAELSRRGTTVPEMEVSGHAIDRASLQCRKIWHETRGADEGISSWLHRVAGEALLKEQDDKGRRHHLGMLFAFQEDGVWPVLVTVMRGKAES